MEEDQRNVAGKDIVPESASVSRHPRTESMRPASEQWQQQLARRDLAMSARPQIHVQLKASKPWQSWSEMSIRIENLPCDITTWDLWRRFRSEGNIVFIEVYENRAGFRDGNARIRFSQPPHVRPFWESQVTIMCPSGAEANIRVVVEQAKRSFQIRSPVRKGLWYPEQIISYPRMINFGFMYEPKTMKIMSTVGPRATPTGYIEQTLRFMVDLLRLKLEIKFPVVFSDPRTPENILQHPGVPSYKAYDRVDDYMFELPFKQLERIRHYNISEKEWGISISVKSPPRFFRRLRDTRLTHEDGAMMWSERDTWYRTTDVVYLFDDLKKQSVSLDKDKSVIDIGRWTTYQFVFNKNAEELRKFQLLKKVFADWNIEVVEDDSITRNECSRARYWSIMKPNHDNSLFSMSTPSLPFEVIYQLEVCISQGVLNEHSIEEVFVDKLSRLAIEDSKKARYILEYIAEQGSRVFDPISIFTELEALAYSPHSTIPPYCTYTRKATVTPTSLYFSTPTVETSNRVTRHFSSYGDRFLRVQFTDEKAEGRVSSCHDKRIDDEIFTRVFRTLKNGIAIGERHYEFLAFGNSQFRENGAYFFSPAPDLTCEDIRSWMGDFSDIMVPAKYAARLGLCFSTTRAIHHAIPRLRPLEDVERNGYCFTDGVGKISEILAAMIARELQLPSDTEPPSAFQFRMGGCKGMLVTWADVKGYDIWIRRSQQKFTARYSGLEIIRWSRFSTATLNRQTITILSALGVSDDIFNRKLLEQLSNYQKAMDDKSLMLELLKKYIDENQVTITIAALVIDGFMTSKEPFMMSLLHLWRSWSIKLLKEKAKIIVEEGAFVLGVTDETGILKGHQHGLTQDSSKPRDIAGLPQIFLQISDKHNKHSYNIVTGICIIGRNPSLHPGDLRIVHAIDVPELHHLKNVVVFSQNGECDVPSMCSGGDLDGDDFFVLWDKELIPPRWNVDPMNYTAAAPTTLTRQVKINDLMKFFVTYMKKDTLSSIALAHLAQADFLDNGVEDERCLKLAALHSKAVDYVKTGIPATMEKRLRPRMWPHFMERTFKPKDAQYVSHKVLGQLYDKVERVKFVPQYEEKFDGRILNACPRDGAILMKARQLKTKYDTAMLRIMAQYDIQTEFEVWSSFVLSKPRVGSGYKLQEEMGVISEGIKARFRCNVIDYVGSKTYEALAPFVAAMYRVSFEEMQIALKECHSTKILGGRQVPKRTMEPKSMPLMSFPWLFHDVLGRIATGSQERYDLEKLGPKFLPNRKEIQYAENINLKPEVEPAIDKDFMDENFTQDYIKTDGGLVHRGETLDLFHEDDVDSDGDPVQRYDESFEISSDGSGVPLQSEEMKEANKTTIKLGKGVRLLNEDGLGDPDSIDARCKVASAVPDKERAGSVKCMGRSLKENTPTDEFHNYGTNKTQKKPENISGRLSCNTNGEEELISFNDPQPIVQARNDQHEKREARSYITADRYELLERRTQPLEEDPVATFDNIPAATSCQLVHLTAEVPHLIRKESLPFQNAPSLQLARRGAIDATPFEADAELAEGNAPLPVAPTISSGERDEQGKSEESEESEEEIIRTGPISSAVDELAKLLGEG